MKTIEQLYKSYVEGLGRLAPPPPLAELKKLLSAEFGLSADAEATVASQGVDTLWHRLFERFPALFGAPGYADGGVMVARERPSGSVPAIALRPDVLGRLEDIEVAVFDHPFVSEDGCLVTEVRVPILPFLKGTPVSVSILAAPDGKQLNALAGDITAGAKRVLVFKLPSDLQAAWRELRICEWKDLPFRFQISPAEVISEKPSVGDESESAEVDRLAARDERDKGNAQSLNHVSLMAKLADRLGVLVCGPFWLVLRCVKGPRLSSPAVLRNDVPWRR